MALNTYWCEFVGQKTGAIKGNCTQTKREGWGEVIACNHGVKSPRDAASGLASGKRQYLPFTMTMQIDKSLPPIYNMLAQNEVITKIHYKFFAATQLGQRAIGAGNEYNVFDILLENAHVCEIQLRMLNNKNPELMRYETYAEISFTYQKITWTWNDGGITAMDDWEAPVV